VESKCGFVKLNNGTVRVVLSRYLAGQIKEVPALDSRILEYLERDLVRIPSELNDLLNAAGHVRLFVCTLEDRLTGYLIMSTVPEAIFVNLSGEKEAVTALLSVVPRSGVVIIAPSSLLDTIQEHFGVGPVFHMVLMAVRRGGENLRVGNPALRLSPQSAPEYARLLNSSSPSSRFEELLQRDAVYGVFVGERLVSVASAVGKLPQAAFIMGVVTSPEYRGRGYGTLAASAAVRDALASSELASLGVREDNIPAIRIYQRLGFKRVGEEVWVDLGTGLKP
jgi:ribosomal protein S18 acetylase RimI-like enzyme